MPGKVNIRRASFEFISIVVAVVLAMALTEWRQDYLNRKLAQQSLDNIVEEVQKNREELLNDSTNIAADLKFMSQWMEDFRNENILGDFKVNFSYSFLSKSALEVAKINNSLTYLDNQVNMQIAELYATQDFYSENGARLFDIMGRLGSIKTKEDQQEFYDTVRELRFNMVLVMNTVKAYLKDNAGFDFRFFGS